MASLFLITELLGRQRSAITALSFAAAVMVGINTQILWTASFQLSFLAMAGLIFIAPPFQALGRKVASRTLGEDGVAVSIANIITDSFAVTLGAVITVWPVIAGLPYSPPPGASNPTPLLPSFAIRRAC